MCIRDSLLVALRVLLVPARRVEVEAGDELSPVRGIHATPEVGEVLDGLAAGEAVVERELAGDVADAAVDGDRVGRRFDAEDTRATRGRPDQVEEGADRGRLAGAVRAKEAEHLALRDGEVDLDDPAVFPVRLREPLGLDHVQCGYPRLRAHQTVRPGAESRPLAGESIRWIGPWPLPPSASARPARPPGAGRSPPDPGAARRDPPASGPRGGPIPPPASRRRRASAPSAARRRSPGRRCQPGTFGRAWPRALQPGSR